MIYDCFLFCHELDALELRFRILFDKVDKFVIGEARQTFMADPKPMFYADNKDRFKQWESKIVHLEIPNCHGRTPEMRETFQRDYLAAGIGQAKAASDVIYLNDADEFPNVTNTSGPLLSKGGILRLVPYWGMYFLNYHVQDRPWPHMRACRADYLRWHTMSELRWNTGGVVAQNGGWHFQNLGGAKAIAYKCRSFAHAKNPSPEYKATWQSETHIQAALERIEDESCTSPIVRCENFLKMGPGPQFPDYINQNWEGLKAKGLIL